MTRKVVKSCLREVPCNYLCFTRCFAAHIPEVYNTVTGYNLPILLQAIGNDGLEITSRKDWKIGLGDKFVKECLEQIKPNKNDTLYCKDDVSVFESCYWKKMFDRCPKKLKNKEKCEQLFT